MALKVAVPEHTKHAHLRPHHAKPYRGRHLSALGLLTIVGLALIIFVMSYQSQIQRGIEEAQNFVESLFVRPAATASMVSSSFGYSISYDSAQFYASGVDAQSGDLFINSQLDTKRAYSTIRISPTRVDQAHSQSALRIRYLDGIGASTLTDASMKSLDRNQVLADVDPATTETTQTASSLATLDGTQFLHSSWMIRAKTEPASLIPVYLETYIGVVHGRAMVILINTGSTHSLSAYSDVLSTLRLTPRTQALNAPHTREINSKISANTQLMDSALLVGLASAEAATPQKTVSDIERATSLYSPAVVKIYNVYCLDLAVQGSPFLQNACSGATGSGFFVSSNGDIATNGHVATSSLKDIAIGDVVESLLSGSPKNFSVMATIAGVQKSDFNSTMTNTEILDIAVNKMYALPDSTFAESNSVHNLLVSLTSKQPDTKELVALTKKRQSYTEQDSIKHATLTAADYRAIDGIKSFHASDVALIKIAGSNYPVAKLGTLEGLIQGSDLAILGFPGNATNNGIVASNESVVTLTAGKVSGIKDAQGSSKKLIETDTTIGHGNSGGPALTPYGTVVGIATYTSDGSGKGNGTFNYIRDIADLKTLAIRSGVTLGDSGQTQKEWEKGIAAFYNSHYSSAIKSFEKVQGYYAQHPKASEFIAAASEHIKKGEDIQDFPTLLVVLIGLGVLAGLGITIAVILRHRAMHQVFKSAVGTAGATTATTPVTAGLASIPAVNPVVSSTLSPAVDTASTPTSTAVFSPSSMPLPPVQAPSEGVTMPVLNHPSLPEVTTPTSQSTPATPQPSAVSTPTTPPTPPPPTA
jgi:S1-C subfamily serine protease